MSTLSYHFAEFAIGRRREGFVRPCHRPARC